MATTPSKVETPSEIETGTFTVAPGRSFTHDGKHFGPGDEVKNYPIEEGERWRDLGFFVGEDGKIRVRQADGPAVVQGDDLPEK
jgi:hypothetical protein